MNKRKEHTEKLLNAIQSGVFIVDAKTQKIIEVNSAAIAMIEAPKDEIIGRKYFEFFTTKETNKGEKSDNSAYILLAKTGKEKDILKTRSEMRLGGRAYFLDSFTDITEQTLVEKKLRESENTLK